MLFSWEAYRKGKARSIPSLQPLLAGAAARTAPLSKTMFSWEASPPHMGHQSGSGNHWIRMGVRDWSEIGALGPFARMENANWLILGF